MITYNQDFFKTHCCVCKIPLNPEKNADPREFNNKTLGIHLKFDKEHCKQCYLSNLEIRSKVIREYFKSRVLGAEIT